MVSEASLACGLNETGQSGQVGESFKLNGTGTLFTGIGTQLGVQTDIGLDQATQTTPDYCTAPAGQTNLGDIVTYAIDNGTQFIEVTSDLVADSNCYSYMATVLSVLLSPTRSSCLY
jgi:hypothetical protein